jgi:hypothetical protein
MKRVALLAIVAVVTLAQSASAAYSHIWVGCYDRAWVTFTTDSNVLTTSTWIGVRLSDGHKVVRSTLAHCGGTCYHGVDEDGILWKNHEVQFYGLVSGHEAGCW